MSRSPRRAVVYIRVSTLKQVEKALHEDGYSLPAQKEACLNKARQLGVDVVDTYVERGESAKSANRTELSRMLKRIRDRRDIQHVIVHKINRLSRRLSDMVKLTEELQEYGCQLVSVVEGIEDSAAGHLQFNVLASVGQYELENLRTETLKGMRRKAREEGGTNYKAPLGYRNTLTEVTDPASGSVRRVRTVVCDDSLAAHISWIFTVYATGEWTAQDIADDLNGRGIRLPATRKKPQRPFTAKAVIKILGSRYYLGEVKFEGVWMKGRHSPLTDPETFRRAEAIRAARHASGEKTRYGGHYLKSLLFCARCTEALGTTRSRNRWGTVYRYFHCLGRNERHNGCRQPHVAIERIEQAVNDYWQRLEIPDGELAVLRAKALAKLHKEHDHAKAKSAAQAVKLARIEDESQKLLTAYYNEAISVETLRREQARIDSERASTNKVLDDYQAAYKSAKENLDQALAVCRNASALYSGADEVVRRMLNKEVFERLWIEDASVTGAEVTPLYREVLNLASSPSPAYTRRLPGAAYLSRTLHRVSRLLAMERPTGRMSWEIQNPAYPGNKQGLGFDFVVTLANARPNPELIKYIQRHIRSRKPRKDC